MGTYKAKQRKKFATVGDDGYPIGDKKHARLALDFIDKGSLSPAQKASVRAKAARFGVTSAKESPPSPKSPKSPKKGGTL